MSREKKDMNGNFFLSIDSFDMNFRQHFIPHEYKTILKWKFFMVTESVDIFAWMGNETAYKRDEIRLIDQFSSECGRQLF